MSYTLNIKINPIADPSVKDYYTTFTTHHDGDSGIDLLVTDNLTVSMFTVGTIDHNIQCEMLDSTGANVSYYLYPRSSISKTDLMMANSVGIIDAGYRGNIMAKVRNMNLTSPAKVNKGDKLFQICAPDLRPIHVILLEREDELTNTTRGIGGFGSTGK
jgi:dUTP pyrophosphatase